MAREPKTKPAAKDAADKPVRRPATRTRAKSDPGAKPLQAAKPEVAVAPKKKRRVTLPNVEATSTTVRTILLNLAFCGVILLLIPIIASQFLRDEVVIEPISVPDGLAKIGLTPDVVAHRLWDGLKDAETRAATSKRSVVAVPNSERIEFSIPESGLSIESIVTQTRMFFRSYQTRISGEFICADIDCTPGNVRLRLRVLRDRSDVIEIPVLGDVTGRDYYTEAAIQVLSVLDPFTAISATADTEPKKAVALARQLIRTHHPDSQWAHNLIGNVRRNDKELELAVAEYRAALELDPGFEISRINLANSLLELKRFDEAKVVYDAAARAAPNNPEIYVGYAELAAATNKPDEAVAHMLKAAQLAPDDAIYLARAGQIYTSLGKREQGIALLKQALQVDPANELGLSALGYLYFSEQNYALAEPIYRDYADYSPASAYAQNLHAQTLMLIGRYEEALARFEAASAIEPTNADYLDSAATMLMYLERIPEARERFAALVALDPDRAESHADLSQASLFMGRFDDALVEADKAIELDPASADYAALKAESLYYLGRVPEALAVLDTVMTLDPLRIQTWVNYGTYYAALGDSAKARESYEKFLAFAPDIPVYRPMRDLVKGYLAEMDKGTVK